MLAIVCEDFLVRLDVFYDLESHVAARELEDDIVAAVVLRPQRGKTRVSERSG